jgi:hypothetical protein
MNLRIALIVFLLSHLPVHAINAGESRQKDVRFVVLGKTANYRQSAFATHKLLNYHFFAEIFLKEKGSVRNAALIVPGVKQNLIFKGDKSVLEVHGGRYRSEAELNQAFPDGEYIFSYRLSDNTLLNETVRIKNDSGNSRIPDAITIFLSQAGKPIKAKQIDAKQELRVTWSVFNTGDADLNGIVYDLVFVVAGNCHGKKIGHSGGPFGEGDFLTFASTGYIIPASKLYPGEDFQIFVEHAEMDSSMYREIPEIATYATTSFLDIRTQGDREPRRKKCPSVMPAMDGGQTDRAKTK